MATFKINEGYSTLNREVTAWIFATQGEFVDFYNEQQEIVLRVRASDVYTIEKETD